MGALATVLSHVDTMLPQLSVNVTVGQLERLDNKIRQHYRPWSLDQAVCQSLEYEVMVGLQSCAEFKTTTSTTTTTTTIKPVINSRKKKKLRVEQISGSDQMHLMLSAAQVFYVFIVSILLL